MAESNTEQSRQKSRETQAADHALYQATQSSEVSFGANLLADKTGLSREIGEVIVLALQQMLGMQNGGAVMNGSVRSSIQRMGVPALLSSNGYNGPLSGGGYAASTAGAQIQSRINENFFFASGAAKANAQGLSQAEIAQVVGHVMKSGAQYQFGPMIKQETLTNERIRTLNNRARDTGDADMMRKLAKASEGDIMSTTDTEGMRRFNKYIERAVEVVKGVKELTGAQTIRELDAQMNSLLGSPLPEFGVDNAKRLVSRIQSAGVTHFGGNKGAALAHFQAGSDFLTSQLALSLGMNPGDPATMGLLRSLGSGVNSADAFAGVYGSTAQAQNNARLRETGTRRRTRGAEEIQSEISRDKAIYLAQEKEAVALTHLLQTRGESLSQSERDSIRDKIRDLGSAGSAKEIRDRRSELGHLFKTITGETVGSYMGGAANQAEIYGELSGESLGILDSTLSDANQSRMNEVVKREYSNSSLLNKKLSEKGLDSSSVGNLGLGIANLSNAQFSKLSDSLGDTEAVSALLKNSDVVSALDKAGVDISKFIKDIESVGGGDLNTMRGMGQEASDSFVATGDRRAAAIKSLQDFVSLSQSGPAASRGDAISEFIKGFVGEEEMRGGSLVTVANNRKIGGGSARLDKSGMFDSSVENMKAIASSEAGKAAMKEMGVSTPEELVALVGRDPEQHQRLLNSLTSSGAYRIDADDEGTSTLKFLSEKEKRATRNSLEADAYARVMGSFSGVDYSELNDDEKKEFEANYRKKAARLDGESAKDYENRMDKKVKSSFLRYLQDENQSYGTLASGIATSETMADKVAMASKSLDATSRGRILRGISEQEKAIEERMQKAKDNDSFTEEKKERMMEQLIRLDETRRKITSGAEDKSSMSYVHVEYMNVGESGDGGMSKKSE